MRALCRGAPHAAELTRAHRGINVQARSAALFFFLSVFWFLVRCARGVKERRPSQLTVRAFKPGGQCARVVSMPLCFQGERSPFGVSLLCALRHPLSGAIPVPLLFCACTALLTTAQLLCGLEDACDSRWVAMVVEGGCRVRTGWRADPGGRLKQPAHDGRLCVVVDERGEARRRGGMACVCVCEGGQRAWLCAWTHAVLFPVRHWSGQLHQHCRPTRLSLSLSLSLSFPVFLGSSPSSCLCTVCASFKRKKKNTRSYSPLFFYFPCS